MPIAVRSRPVCAHTWPLGPLPHTCCCRCRFRYAESQALLASSDAQLTQQSATIAALQQQLEASLGGGGRTQQQPQQQQQRTRELEQQVGVSQCSLGLCDAVERRR